MPLREEYATFSRLVMECFTEEFEEGWGYSVDFDKDKEAVFVQVKLTIENGVVCTQFYNFCLEDIESWRYASAIEEKLREMHLRMEQIT